MSALGGFGQPAYLKMGSGLARWATMHIPVLLHVGSMSRQKSKDAVPHHPEPLTVKAANSTKKIHSDVSCIARYLREIPKLELAHYRYPPHFSESCFANLSLEVRCSRIEALVDLMQRYARIQLQTGSAGWP